MQPYTDYDLNQEETHESTTAYGLHFLEMIRRTKDKRYGLAILLENPVQVLVQNYTTLDQQQQMTPLHSFHEA
jgi:hypothetical protein